MTSRIMRVEFPVNPGRRNKEKGKYFVLYRIGPIYVNTAIVFPMNPLSKPNLRKSLFIPPNKQDCEEQGDSIIAAKPQIYSL